MKWLAISRDDRSAERPLNLTPNDFPKAILIGINLLQVCAWLQIGLAVIAGTCAASGICGVNEDPVLYAARATQVLLYAAVGTFLLAPSRKPAARAFGLMLLTIASSFTQGVVMRTDIWGAPNSVAALIMSIRVDAFLPFATWLLAACFHESQQNSPPWRMTLLDRIAAIGTNVMAVVGIALVIAHLSTHRIMIDGDLAAYDAVATGYWTTVFAGTLAGLAVMAMKARVVSPEERARLRLVLTHLITVGGVVAIYVVLTEQSPELRDVLAQGELHRLLMPLLQVLVLSLPFVATYALLVESAVDETLRVRNQVGYYMASTMLAIGAAVPFLLVAWYLWNLRGQTISDAFSGANLTALIGAVSLGVVLFRMRASASAAVDRAFVRIPYDVNGLLAELHDRIATAKSADELARYVADALATLGYDKTQLNLSPEPKDVNDADSRSSPSFPWRVPIKRDNGTPFA